MIGARCPVEAVADDWVPLSCKVEGFVEPWSEAGSTVSVRVVSGSKPSCPK